MPINETPVTFSKREALVIRRAFERGMQEILCPRCGIPMRLSQCFQYSDRLVSEIFCDDCHRCVMVHVTEEPSQAGHR